jgi:murein DD-endopeptidase MepM/ murein hydrolase activator NlpD
MKHPIRRPLAVSNLVTPALALLLALGASSTASHAELVVVSTGPVAGLVQLPADRPVSAAQGFWNPDQDDPCITPEQHAEIAADLAANVADLKARGLLPQTSDKTAGVLLQWPVQAAPGLDDPGVHGISNYVDENLAYPNQLRDYNCGTRTYDNASAYNHAGTDIFSWPFSWYRMDHDQVQIVAAAPGVIIGKYDGNYDRRCSGSGLQWNAVYVQHADGSVAWYGHLKKLSLTAKNVGDPVAVGEFLGIMGSSGNSSGPHLHLEIYDNAGHLVDPWMGACNTMNPDGWWAAQRPYYDSAINALRTHSIAPVFPACPNTESINENRYFAPGALAFFSTYYRDQRQGQLSTYEILRPNGTVWQQWTGSLGVLHYAASWWYWSWYLPVNAETGTWTFRVTYEGQTVTRTFGVGVVADAPPPAADDVTVLHVAEPNPFNPSTTIRFHLGEAGPAQLSIHDLQGRRVATLCDGELPAGEQSVVWNGRGVDGALMGSGVYLVHLRSGGRDQVQRVVLLK